MTGPGWFYTLLSLYNRLYRRHRPRKEEEKRTQCKWTLLLFIKIGGDFAAAWTFLHDVSCEHTIVVLIG
jgi:hypothetical protein